MIQKEAHIDNQKPHREYLPEPSLDPVPCMSQGLGCIWVTVTACLCLEFGVGCLYASRHPLTPCVVTGNLLFPPVLQTLIWKMQ